MYDFRSVKEKKFGITFQTPYKHYKNKKIYSPIRFGNLQVDGEWVPAVTYIEMYSESDEEYHRPVSEFLEKFTKEE